MGGLPWWKAGCLGIIFAIAIGFFAFTVLEGNTGYDVPVDGIQCGIMMNGFDVHAHLSLFDAGHQVFL
jgi:hypothetical protein